MGFKAEIQESIKVALKSGDQATLSTLRLLLSALQNEEIKNRRDLTSEEILKTVSTHCKQRQEAIEHFRRGGRADLVAKEEKELEILRKLLPQPLTEDEVRQLILATVQEVKAQGIQDLGKVMKQLMPKVTGRTEGKRVSDLAKEILSG